MKKRLNALDEAAERVEIDLLLSIAHRFGGVRVDFHQQAVRAERHRAFAQFGDQIGAAATLARIDDDRQVGFFFGDRHGGKVERVARVGFECPDAALAEDDLGVSMGEKVFGGEEPFLDALAHTALEQDGLAGLRALDEELEILGVARADLQDVGRGGDMLDITLAQNLGDDFQAGLAAGEVEEA